MININKIKNIQALRGIAVLSVILFHLLSIENKYGGLEKVLPDFFRFGMFGVDLFFVISGFVMVAVTRGKFRIPSEALTFLYRRMARIYPLYWFYTILVFGVYIVHPTWVNSSQGNQVDILSSFLLLPSQVLPLIAVGWSLVHELYFYLVFFVIFLLVRERFLLLSLGVWAGVVFCLHTWFTPSNPTLLLISHPLTIEFLAGCFLAHLYFRNSLKIINTHIWKMILLSSAVILSGCIIGFILKYQMGVPTGWWRILIFGVPAILTVFCVTEAEKRGTLLPEVLVIIGDASYSLYLSHVLVLSAAGRVWRVFSYDGVLDNMIMLPLLLLTVIAFGLFSYRFIETPLLNISRRYS